MRARLALISAACVGLIMAVQGVLPALPAVQDAFGFSNAEAGFFTLVYILPGVVLTLPASALAGSVGPRPVLAVSLVVYGASGAAQGLVDSYAAMLALRLVQGTCFAAAMPLTLTLIGNAYEGAAQLRALAVRQTSITVGEFSLPLLGALLAVVSWRAPFLVQGAVVPLGLLALRLLDGRRWPVTPELRGTRRLAAAVLRRRAAVPVMLMSLGRFVFKFSFLGYVPILLVDRAGASVLEGGIVVAAAAAMTALTASRVPRLLERLSPSRLSIAAAGAIALALGWLAVVVDWRLALAPALLFGFGDGVLIVLQDAYVTRLWAPEVRAAAASVSQTARNVGKLASPLAMTAFLLVTSVPVAFALIAGVACAMVPVFASLARVDAEFAGGASVVGLKPTKEVPT